jgi:urocanate hydratase
MLLDGSLRVDEILKQAIPWDVMSGVARRAWAGNNHALETSREYNKMATGSLITMPYPSDSGYLENLVRKNYQPHGK